MPRLKNGRSPRVLKGEYNPRHYIMIAIGVGNQYCRNCDHLSTINDIHLCSVFKERLAASLRFGPERCPQCRAAEKSLFDAKQDARKAGAEESFLKEASGGGKSSLLNAAV